MSELLALPSPEDASKSIELDVTTGAPKALDALGPIVVNSDGYAREDCQLERDDEKEQQVTQRRIAKRNLERLKDLREQGVLDENVVSALTAGCGGGSGGRMTKMIYCTACLVGDLEMEN